MGKHHQQDLPKYQSCILKVNIHCEGCENKVRKLLQKTDGVYSVNIDADSGKVLVAGNMDPAKLIKKLKRSGKHAELWGGGQRGNMYNQNYPPVNQFKNFQIDPAKMGKHNEPHKVIGMNQLPKGGGAYHQPHFQNKGAQNPMMPIKNQKSVKFNLPEEDDFDASVDSDDEDLDEFDDEDEFDDFDDDEEDEEEVGHAHPLMPNKANMMMGRGPHAGPAMNFPKANGGVNGKKGNVIDFAVQMKGKGGNKHGDGGEKKKKNEERDGIKKDKGGKCKASGDKKNGKSNGGFFGRLLGMGKKSKKADSPRFKKNGVLPVKANHKEVKKSGARFEGHNFKKLDDDGECFRDFDIPIKSKSGKGVKGNGHGMPAKMGHVAPPQGQTGPMDQMRNIPMPAVQGMPAAAMNGGFYQGMQMQAPRPLPYNPQQQQYMAMMMNQQQQQQQAHMNQMYPAMMYGRPQGPMGYMAPPPMPSHPMADPMTHVFSDENTESCAIM